MIDSIAAATVAQLVMPALTADGVGDGPFAPLVLDLIGKAQHSGAF
jgi:hypothetical protein